MKTKIQIGVIITFLACLVLIPLIEFANMSMYWQFAIKTFCGAMIIGCYFVFYPIRRNKRFKRSSRPEWCKYQLNGKSAYSGCYELQNDKIFTNQICKICPDGKLYKSKA